MLISIYKNISAMGVKLLDVRDAEISHIKEILVKLMPSGKEKMEREMICLRR